MNIHVAESYEDMSARVAHFVANEIKEKPNGLICFASGDTPTGMLQHIVKMSKDGDLDLTRIYFVGLDEWVGLDKNDTGSCQHYLYSQLFNPLKIAAHNIMYFNAKEKNLAAECRRVDEYILWHGGIDVMVVGIGLNGHIGLNEPGTSIHAYSHVVPLQESTIASARKYFDVNTKPEHGITLGIRHVMEAKTVAVIASGLKKSDIVQKILEGEIISQVPGSILQRHKNCHCFLDEAAASRLTLL